MEHRHPVTDTDAHFEINTITRNITAVSGKSALIQGDHNSERFTFDLSSRRVDTHDMSLCNVVQIHYINIDAATKAQSTGVYEVNDMIVSEEDENKVTLSWLISNNATRYAGSLNFLIKFKCVEDNGEVSYVWNTGIFKNISVSDGMDNGEAIVEDYSDILEQWRHELFDGGGAPGGCTIKRIESQEETGIRNLRELDSGAYILHGYFNAYPAATDYMPFDNRLVTVEKQAAGSQLFVFKTLNAKIDFHEILVDESSEDGFTHTRTEIDLLSLYTGSTATIGVAELLADKWVGSDNLYSQIVTIDGVTENSQVDLTPSVEQLVVFYEKDLTFVTENEGGIVTVYAIGQKPENDYTIQVTITEVAV